MKRACVIGRPIRHSRSPLIHGHWLRQHGIEGTYTREEVAPEHLRGFLERVGGDLAGCNVTVPHKEAVLPMLDEVDDIARAIGAVNTVWSEGGRVLGTNTDVAGFLANLDQGTPGWDREPLRAVVLGAGGAARAVVYGLILRGAAEIVIVNRSPDRTEDLAKEFGRGCRAAGFDDVPALLGEATLLVNATSLGMVGKPPLVVSLNELGGDCVVTDLVYAPLLTGLLRTAAERGNRIADGLGMLLHQAVPGFEKWFGVRPEVTPELRELVEADLLGRGS